MMPTVHLVAMLLYEQVCAAARQLSNTHSRQQMGPFVAFNLSGTFMAGIYSPLWGCCFEGTASVGLPAMSLLHLGVRGPEHHPRLDR